MTESNTNDRRFWMVISKITNVDTGIESFEVVKSIVCTSTFNDPKAADLAAAEFASLLGGDEVYVVEAVSKYSLPCPRVIKQNLHIPPITAREDKQNGNE